MPLPRLPAVTAGAIAAALLGGAVTTAAASSQTAAEPARVSVVSGVLDTFESGSRAGPGLFNGVVNTVIGSEPLPPPADQAQQALIDTTGQLFGQMAAQGPEGIDQMRPAVAPLACLNAPVNDGLGALAGGLDAGADQFAEAIQPFDVSAHATATLLRSFVEPEDGCPM